MWSKGNPVCLTFQLCFWMALFLLVDSANPKTRRTDVMDRLEQESRGVSALVLIHCLQWVSAYFTFTHYPDWELPNFYPIFTIISSFSGLFALAFLGMASKYYRTEGTKVSVSEIAIHFSTYPKLRT